MSVRYCVFVAIVLGSIAAVATRAQEEAEVVSSQADYVITNQADVFTYPLHSREACDACGSQGCPTCVGSEETYHWQRDELQEKRRTIRIYNLHCVRCHGVSGRGVWDIPDVPNFTDARWQHSRSDADIVRLTLGGRGACMPAFKGTVSYLEAWAIARYIRTFDDPPRERMPKGQSGRPDEIIEKQSGPSVRLPAPTNDRSAFSSARRDRSLFRVPRRRTLPREQAAERFQR